MRTSAALGTQRMRAVLQPSTLERREVNTDGGFGLGRARCQRSAAATWQGWPVGERPFRTRPF